MEPIPLISRLAAELDAAGVVFCHWKSNLALDEAEQGQTDLDLLVDQSGSGEFNAILARCGFVAAARPHLADPPAVTHFFGFDAAADKFVHVHAHYQLILGHDRSKNYRLPIEDAYLASAKRDGVLPVPSPEFEYMVLVIRMVLKYAIADEIVWEALRRQSAGPSKSERAELDDLRPRVDHSVVLRLVSEHLPFVGVELYRSAETLFDRGSAAKRLSVSRAMHAALAPYARSPESLDIGRRVWRRLSLAVRRRTGKTHGFRLAGGGAIIAIMGGDGAGKSTALEEIARWLSRDFDVGQVHLGKPPWSWTTYIVRGALKLASKLGLLGENGEVDGEVVDSGETPGPDSYRQLVWYACKSRDRYREYRKARGAANRGTIILSDRFPHPALRDTDVPQIRKLTASGSTPALRVLGRLEERYHSKVALPDLAFVLVVEPKEAARRKTDERYDYVLERATEIWETDWSRHDVHVVDAGKSAQEVAAELKTLIWDTLS